MAFVQISRASEMTQETFDRLMEAWTGGQVLDGMQFLVGGPGNDGAYYVVDAWDTREQCDAGFDRYNAAVEQLGIDPPSWTLQEFEIQKSM
jgi:hypothetical protein